MYLNKKYETPQHYKPLGKRAGNGVFYTTLILITGVILYILSFYI